MSNDVLSDVPPRRSPLATVYDYVRGQSLVVGPGRRTVPALVRAVSSLYKHRMAHIVPTNRGIIYMLIGGIITAAQVNNAVPSLPGHRRAVYDPVA